MTKSLFLIGLFVSIVVVGMSVYIFLASDSIGFDTYELYVIFDNANGLLIDGDVRVSGVKIGRIKAIDLVDNKAKLTLSIKKDIKILDSYTLKRVPLGILGASFLAFEPNNGRAGSLLDDKSTITNVDDKTLIDKLSNSATDIVGNMDITTRQIQEYLSSSDLLNRIDSIATGLDSTIKNINIITTELVNTTQANTQNINAIISSMTTIIHTVEQYLVYNQDLGNSDLNETLAAIRESLQNIQKITGSLANGEGTIGKLLIDDTLYNEATTAVSNINSITNRAAGLYTDLDYQYHGLISETSEFKSRNTINLLIDPANTSRYYQVGVTLGGAEKFDSAPKYTSSIGNVKINLMLAQRLGNMFTLRGGLLENTGGLGVDFMPIKQLQITGEGFDFGGGNANALLRTSAYVYPFFNPSENSNPLKWLYIGGGIDDILESYKRNYFFAVGIRIHDEFIYDAVRVVPLASATSTIAK